MIRSNSLRAALAAWLRQVARNRMRQQNRSVRHGVELADADELEAAWLRNAGDDNGGDYVDALRECLAELPERQRRATSGPPSLGPISRFDATRSAMTCSASRRPPCPRSS